MTQNSHMTQRNERRLPRLEDVADRAGVSHQTVSRVINNHPNVSASTRGKVEAAIAELGYRRNTAARSLVTRRSQTIGVLGSEMSQYGPANTLLGVEQAARDAGYFVSIAALREVDVDVALAVSRRRRRGTGRRSRPTQQGAGLADDERVGAELDLDLALLGEAGERDHEDDDQDHQADDDAAEGEGQGPGVAGGALLDGAHEAQRFADGPAGSQSGTAGGTPPPVRGVRPGRARARRRSREPTLAAIDEDIVRSGDDPARRLETVVRGVGFRMLDDQVPFRRLAKSALEQWFSQVGEPAADRGPVREGRRNRHIAMVLEPLRGSIP